MVGLMAAHSTYSDDAPARAGLLAAAGRTEFEIADALGITDRTLRRWKCRFPTFSDALSEGKAQFADRAKGYLGQAEAIAFHGEEPVIVTLSHIVPIASPATARKAA